jgi:hypothetical protein
MQGNTPIDNPRRWIFRKAITVSLMLTAVMAICGTISNLVQPLAWLSYISRAIAFPPSLIARHLITNAGGSMAAVITLELAGLAFAVIFYALLAGAVFWFLNRQAEKTK